MPRLRKKRSRISPGRLLSTLPGRSGCPVPCPRALRRGRVPGQVLRGRGGAEPGRQGAVLAERRLRILSVNPGMTACNGTPAGRSRRAEGSRQPPCRRRIAAPVPPGMAGSGPEPFPTRALCTALQTQVCHRSRRVDAARAPAAMFRCQSGARCSPSNPGLSPELGPSHSPLRLRCCPVLPRRGTRRSGGEACQQFGVSRAPSAPGQGTVTIFTAQLRDPRPGGIVWFCPHSR